MSLTQYLNDSRISVCASEVDWRQIVGRLTRDCMTGLPPARASEVCDALICREAETSTVLPTGIAIPHLRVKDVDDISVQVGVVPEGCRVNPDMPPVHVFVLFLSPQNEKTFGAHLKLLSSISQIFRDMNFTKNLSRLSKKEDIIQELTLTEKKFGISKNGQ